MPWPTSLPHRCSATRCRTARLRPSRPGGCNGEADGRAVPRESSYQGADGKDHRQWLHRGRGDGGGGDGGAPARALRAQHGRDRDPHRPLRSGRGAAWRTPAATDRRLCAGDRPLLRLQGLAWPRRLPGSHATGGGRGGVWQLLCVFRLRDRYRTLATYLFAVIERAVRTETATFRKLNPRLQGVRLRRASASFQHGVVARVSDRLDAMRRARDATVRAQGSTGTDLIVAKNR